MLDKNKEEEELDRLELEAALSAACHSADSAEISMAYSAPPEGLLEVSYKDGGTPLFQQLEQCEWQKAFELCTQESLMTWVKSTGTTNTTFGWSVWRRLPIHEVCSCSTTK
jgi:hypothetical protein